MRPFIKVKIEDFLRQAATDIIINLTAPPSTTTPRLEVGGAIRNILLQLVTILQQVEKIKTPEESSQDHICVTQQQYKKY